tara:strand:+ start:121 stop:585 length:465 start_codon:yes stop_codon:yes gene_type:complete
MAVFIKISESFVISNGKDKDLAPEYKKPIVGRFKKVKPDTICLSMDHVAFKCGLQNKVSGDLSMEINGKNIEIKCDAIFKINIRPQHKENFLRGEGTWTFDRIQQGDYGDDIVGDVTKGLKLKKYKQKTRNGTFDMVDVIMSNVKTGSKKTDLK